MSKILVLIPMKPNLHADLKSTARTLAGGLPEANPAFEFDVVIDERGKGDGEVASLAGRVVHTAAIRQALIDEHLVDHDYVLWIDADIVRYPADLPTQLVLRNPHGVSAPMVLLDQCDRRFYDLVGFVEAGSYCRPEFPWFRQPGPVYELDGVGTMYIVPSLVYRKGGRHEPCDPFTDHLAVCRKARELGASVRAYEDLVAYHAYLPRYGEQFH